jgi:glycosyltransferase involved in cell wall biosynthesis
MQIAMIGTRGVPARYGGFETAVEEVGRRLVAAGHEVVVYCRNDGQTRHGYEGMRLVNLPALRRRSLETISHTALSSLHAVLEPADVAIVFNAANSPFVPVLRARGIPVALHMDGLEWKRAKWGVVGRRYYRVCERLGSAVADALIADAAAIRTYYREVHDTDAVFIPYGAPILHPEPGDLDAQQALAVEPGKFHLVVARFEPENQVDLIVDGYVTSNSSLPLLVVGSAPFPNAVTAAVERAAKHEPQVRLTGYIEDQPTLDALYRGCATYLHGHSVGGTNPSLLRAMGAAAPVIAFDSPFNREVAGDCAEYFDTVRGLARHFVAAERDPAAARQRGQRGQRRVAETYVWDDVAARYLDLCEDLAGRRLSRSRRARWSAGEPELALSTA